MTGFNWGPIKILFDRFAWYLLDSQIANACLKSTIGTLEKGVKYVQN